MRPARTLSRPGRGRHPCQKSPQDGVRSDLAWRRPGAPRAREQLTNRGVVDTLQWVSSRAGARRTGKQVWTELDERTTREAYARSLGMGDLYKSKLWTIPQWFELIELVGQRRHPQQKFLAMLLWAYRKGAVGVTLSYEEVMALLCCARQTWRNWQKQLEAAGLIRVVQTYHIAPDGKRGYGRLLYRIGPRLEEIGGPALLEDVTDEPKRSGLARMRLSAGVKLRKANTKRRRQAKSDAWSTCRPHAADQYDEAPACRGTAAACSASPASASAPAAAANGPTEAPKEAEERPWNGEIPEDLIGGTFLARIAGPARSAQNDGLTESEGTKSGEPTDATVVVAVSPPRQSTKQTPLYPTGGVIQPSPTEAGDDINQSSSSEAGDESDGRLTASGLFSGNLPPTLASMTTSGPRRPHGGDAGSGAVPNPSASAHGNEPDAAPCSTAPAGAGAPRGAASLRALEGGRSEDADAAKAKVDCPSCGQKNPDPTCGQCFGEGLIVAPPGTPCPRCHTSGHRKGVDCAYCEGGGYLNIVRDCPYCHGSKPDCRACHGTNEGTGGTIHRILPDGTWVELGAGPDEELDDEDPDDSFSDW